MTQSPAAPSAAATPWFVVGGAKLVVMSLVTFGMYQVYWFYQQWTRHRATTGATIQPLARAIFGPVFCYALFSRLATAGIGVGLLGAVAPDVLAVGYALSNLASMLPDPWWLLTHASVVPLLVAQRAATAVALRAVPAASLNDTLTPLNWLAVLVGGTLFLSTAAGVLLPGALNPQSHLYLAREAERATQGLPRMLDAGTELMRVEARQRTLVYTRRLVTRANRDIDRAALQTTLRKAVTADACADGTMRGYLDDDVTLLFAYRDRNFEDVLSIDVRPGDCGR